MRRVIFLSAFVWALFLNAAPAAAGGSWLEWDRFGYQVGERARASGSFGSGCCGRKLPKQGPFYAYAIPRGPFSASDDGILPGRAIRLGVIDTERHDESSWMARLEFIVPPMEPGLYVVMNCDDPCSGELGDTLHPPLRVVESKLEARLWRRIDSLRDPISRNKYELLSATEGFERQLTRVRVRLEDLGNRFGRLEGAVQSREPSPQQGVPWFLAAGTLALGAGGGLWAGLRKSRS